MAENARIARHERPERMPTYNEKKQASEDLFREEHAARESVQETTPITITSEVENFAAELGGLPIRVSVIADQYGLYGWCADGVREKIRREGGSIVFGWTIWEGPNVLLTAEFHSVWQDTAGTLIDITPKPDGEETIVFVTKHEFQQDFDFDDRPVNHRRRIYVPTDHSENIKARIAAMKPAQREYESRRAA